MVWRTEGAALHQGYISLEGTRYGVYLGRFECFVEGERREDRGETLGDH